MSPKTAFPLETLPATKTFQTKPSAVSNTDGDTAPDSLFEHFAWLYIFCREKLFRDDTLPLDILARRFAAGEISAEEYQRARDILRGEEPPKP